MNARAFMKKMSATEQAKAFEFAQRYYPKGESIIVIKRAAKVALDMNSALLAENERLRKIGRLYLLALELYLPSAVGVLGESKQAGALRSAEKDFRAALVGEE